jgi:hypothetical protein
MTFAMMEALYQQRPVSILGSRGPQGVRYCTFHQKELAQVEQFVHNAYINNSAGRSK